MEIEDFSRIVGVGSPIFLWPEQSRPLLVTAIARPAGGAMNRFEGYCLRPGRVRWWEVSTSPICDREGRPVYALCTFLDIESVKPWRKRM